MDPQNIIFDFGGVIYDIDFELTIRAFKELGVNNFHELHSTLKQDRIFETLETGQISLVDFRNHLREKSGLEISDEAIDKAWNSLLTGFRPERIHLLEKISKHYRIYLLSNSNVIHYEKYRNELEEQFGYENFEQLFDKAWFSHEIGKKKPDSKIFEYILRDRDLNPSETLFIDDLEENVFAGSFAGLTGYFLDLSKGEDILDLFEENGKLRLNYG